MPSRESRPRHTKAPRELSLFSPPESAQPLAARMRPRALEEFVGQQHLLAPGKPLRDAVERGAMGYMIF